MRQTSLSIETGILFLGILDFKKHQVQEVADVVRVQGLWMFNNVGFNELSWSREGQIDCFNSQPVPQDRQPCQGWVRQGWDQRINLSRCCPNKVIKEFDDVVDFWIVQLKFLPDKDQPERVDDADVHHPVQVHRLTLERLFQSTFSCLLSFGTSEPHLTNNFSWSFSYMLYIWLYACLLHY